MSNMANRSVISILTALFALLVGLTRATNPGIRFRITNKGLQYGKSHRVGLSEQIRRVLSATAG